MDGSQQGRGEGKRKVGKDGRWNEWTDGRADGRTEDGTLLPTNERTFGRTLGRKGGGTEGQMDLTNISFKHTLPLSDFVCFRREKRKEAGKPVSDTEDSEAPPDVPEDLGEPEVDPEAIEPETERREADHAWCVISWGS